MRKRFLLLFLALVVALAMVPGTATAEKPDRYYVSVGTSLAAGTQADATGGSILFTDESYTDVLATRLKGRLIGEHVKLGCPGETSASMIDGPPAAFPFCNYGGPGVSQLDAAVDFLESHRGEVALITIDMGANDVLPCLGDPDLAVCVGQAAAALGANLTQILIVLQTAAPGVPIVGMNYYNPNLASWLAGPEGEAFAIATTELTAFINGEVLGGVYGGFGVPVADVAGEYRTFSFKGADKGQTPTNVKVICMLTFMCDVGNIHPDGVGYKRIAKAFQEVMRDAGIT